MGLCLKGLLSQPIFSWMTLLFSKANPADAHQLVKILNVFSQASGQRIILINPVLSLGNMYLSMSFKIYPHNTRELTAHSKYHTHQVSYQFSFYNGFQT